MHLILFAFNKGSKAANAVRDLCCVWYAKFKNGKFDIKDAPRPVRFDEVRLNQLLHTNSIMGSACFN